MFKLIAHIGFNVSDSYCQGDLLTFLLENATKGDDAILHTPCKYGERSPKSAFNTVGSSSVISNTILRFPRVQIYSILFDIILHV